MVQNKVSLFTMLSVRPPPLNFPQGFSLSFSLLISSYVTIALEKLIFLCSTYSFMFNHLLFKNISFHLCVSFRFNFMCISFSSSLRTIQSDGSNILRIRDLLLLHHQGSDRNQYAALQNYIPTQDRSLEL
jgi:hypothetical protein